MSQLRWWSDPLEMLGLEAERETPCVSPAHGIILGASLGTLCWAFSLWFLFG